jgi:hypothetical protein
MWRPVTCKYEPVLRRCFHLFSSTLRNVDTYLWQYTLSHRRRQNSSLSLRHKLKIPRLNNIQCRPTQTAIFQYLQLSCLSSSLNINHQPCLLTVYAALLLTVCTCSMQSWPDNWFMSLCLSKQKVMMWVWHSHFRLSVMCLWTETHNFTSRRKPYLPSSTHGTLLRLRKYFSW